MQNKFNLGEIGLVELNQEESIVIDGGGFFTELGYWVGYALSSYTKNGGNSHGLWGAGA